MDPWCSSSRTSSGPTTGPAACSDSFAPPARPRRSCCSRRSGRRAGPARSGPRFRRRARAGCVGRPARSPGPGPARRPRPDAGAWRGRPFGRHRRRRDGAERRQSVLRRAARGDARATDVTGEPSRRACATFSSPDLAGLPPDTQTVLRAASAAGRRVDDELLAAVLEMPARAVADALRPAISQGILVDADRFDDTLGGYAFRHALLAEVANGELLHGERDRLHAAFGEELERRGRSAAYPSRRPNSRTTGWPHEIGPERSRPWSPPVPRPNSVYAFAEARRHYEQALELWDERRVAGTRAAGPHRRPATRRRMRGADRRLRPSGELGRMAIDEAEIGPRRYRRRPRTPNRLGVLHERLRWYLWEAGDVAAAQAAVDRSLAPDPGAAADGRDGPAILAQAAGLRLLERRSERGRDAGT